MLVCRLNIFITLSLLTINSFALPNESRVPGGIAILPLEGGENPHFKFRNKPLLIHREKGENHAIVGLPLSLKAGEYSIEGQFGNDPSLIKIFFQVENKKYTTQEITIKDKRKVNPYEKDMARIKSEQKRKKKAALNWAVEKPELNFLSPVQGIMTGSFGRRRIFNGQSRRPHSGMDIAADKGVPVVSPAAGTVIEKGDFFFSGNIVYIQHGQGLITLFAHLDRIDVELGEKISRGQVIGTVGATGRVTGPHLHWGIGLNGAWIDPALFLVSTQ